MPKISERPFYLGIDPGQSGGLAVISPDGADAVRIPATDRDTWKWIEGLPRDTVAVIEKVGGYIPGRGGNIGSAMFRFGRSFGLLHGFLVAAGISYEEVTPQAWQRALGISGRRRHDKKKRVKNRKGEWVVKRCGGETDTEWKNRLKQHAQRLFPRVAVTLATADALLIAEYCRRKHEGML